MLIRREGRSGFFCDGLQMWFVFFFFFVVFFFFKQKTAYEIKECDWSSDVCSSDLQTNTEDLSTAERDGLIYMREEEKLARDVYLVLYDQWNVRIFGNISKAEQRHTDAVKYLLNRYQVDDPVTNNEIGSFTNQELLKLYNDLTAQGKTSLVEALKVGAAIEEIDILDLQKDIAAADNEDIKLVYNNLMEGSYNHLRAFVRNLSAQGITYSPQYLSPEAYESIINN